MTTSRRRFLNCRRCRYSAILGADDKGGNKLPIAAAVATPTRSTTIGASLPSSIKYGNTHGVCEDSQGRIYVHHTVYATSESSDSMVVFDEKGKFVKSWGKDFKGGAHGLHIRKEGATEFSICATRRAVSW